MVPIEIFFICSFSLFGIGLIGMIIVRNNILVILMAMELMSLALSLNFVICSVMMDDLIGQLMALVIMCGAGAEVAIGLALVLAFYRIRGFISVNFINALKG